METALTVIFFIMVFYASVYTITHNIIPFMVKKGMKEIEKNPKWITSNIHDQYYGFHDIDIILTESKYNSLPYVRVTKSPRRMELLISNDTSIKDVDIIAKQALSAKIKLKYGLYYPDKPAYWLAILCYMLDGGDIKQEATKWEKVEKDNKPVDF